MGSYIFKQPQEHREEEIESPLDRIRKRPLIIHGYIRKYTSFCPQEITQVVYNFLFTQILSYQLQTIGGDETTVKPLETLTTMKTFQKQMKNIINSDAYVYILLADSTYECIGYGGRGGGYKSWLIDIYDKMKINTCAENKKIKISKIFGSPLSEHTFCLDNNHNTYICEHKWQGYGTYQHQWAQLNIQIKIQKIATSENVTIFLNDSGQLFVCGRDNFRDGILGLGKEISLSETITQILIETNTQFVSVYCGLVHTLALDCSGQIWSWGHGGSGRLGHGDDENRYKPTQIKYFMDNNIKVSQICCGTWYSVALSNTGKIYTFGRETNLGVSPNRNVLTPKLNETLKNEEIVSIQCGSHHQMAKNSKNDYYLWGENSYNQCISTLTPDPPCYVEKPLLLEWKKLINKSQEIIDVYLGRYSTRVLLGNAQISKKTDLLINKEIFGMPGDTFKICNTVARYRGRRGAADKRDESDFNWKTWQFVKKNDLPELDYEIYHSAKELLTGPEAQYQTEVIKRIYPRYIVLQFNIQHTLEKRVITDVYVDITHIQKDSQVINIKCSRIKSGEIGITAAIIERDWELEREDSSVLIGKYECVLKCIIEGEDDTTYDEGYEDNYTLNEIKYDYTLHDIYPLFLLKIICEKLCPYGKEQQFRKTKTGTLNYKTLQSAIDFVVKSVGLIPVGESHKVDVSAQAHMHRLYMMAYRDKGQPICMKAVFRLKDGTVQYQVAVICENELLRDQCLHLFGNEI